MRNGANPCQRAAHTMKGSAASVGLIQPAAWASLLDDSASRQRLIGASGLIASLTATIATGIAALRAERADVVR